MVTSLSLDQYGKVSYIYFPEKTSLSNSESDYLKTQI